jgi:hypothetical protein
MTSKTTSGGVNSKATAYIKQKISSWKYINRRFPSNFADTHFGSTGSIDLLYSSRIDIGTGSSYTIGLSLFGKANLDTKLRTIFFRRSSLVEAYNF